MRPFQYERPSDLPAAVMAQGERRNLLAGGTTLLDLMKLDVMRPSIVADINGLAEPALRQVTYTPGSSLRLGALVKMSEAAEDPNVKMHYPLIAQALQLAASQQIRNMASLGGNVLQRTRCTYFRDTSYANCNKRSPGSGCAALEGYHRPHAVLGTSKACIATYPGDFAQALAALDAKVEVIGRGGMRSLPFAQLHRQPEDTPHVETTLADGELITGFVIDNGPWPRSLYLKIRDRQSYEFALASAAIALNVENGTITDARIGLGGVASVPWRAHEAEKALIGKPFSNEVAVGAAQAAFAQAQPQKDNAFKVQLGRQTIIRGLHQAMAMEI